MRRLYLLFGLILLIIQSCSKDVIEYESNDLKISIEAGNGWLHDFPLMLGLTKKNPPQFAIWITDMDTNYIGTIFCTYKIAREGWIANKGNRRKEALPYWCNSRGVQYSDGLNLPTKENPLIDGLTGATPKGSNYIKVIPKVNKDFLIFAEFNHSLDFNEYFEENSPKGSFYYSGGDEGSGQPALVYSVKIDLNSSSMHWELALIGHSSPDGSDGNLYKNLSQITTARSIVKTISVTRQF